MASRPTSATSALRLVFGALVTASLFSFSTSAKADAADAAPTKKATAAPAWCGPSSEALPGILPGSVCYIDGRKKGPRRTLVIWLHGVIAKSTDWSWNHQRMLQRVAKASGVEMIFPRAPATSTLYAWPGTIESQEQQEASLVEEWMAAKDVLAKREDRPFDEVFVFGFSSGAYFASSLAMRGRLDVDGYAVFAGGQPMPARTSPVAHFAPVFVGVCADDATTASHSRAFAGSLAAARIPRMVDEQHAGHELSEAHFARALGFLRSKLPARPGA